MADVIVESFAESNRFSKVIFQRAKDVIDFELNESQDNTRVDKYRSSLNVGGKGSPNDGLLVAENTGDTANKVLIKAGDYEIAGIHLLFDSDTVFSALTTAGAPRTDIIYAALTEQEVVDPNEQSDLGETTKRRQLVVTFAVAEGVSIPADTAQAIWEGGTKYDALSSIARATGVADIVTADLTDVRGKMPRATLDDFTEKNQGSRRMKAIVQSEATESASDPQLGVRDIAQALRFSIDREGRMTSFGGLATAFNANSFSLFQLEHLNWKADGVAPYLTMDPGYLDIFPEANASNTAMRLRSVNSAHWLGWAVADDITGTYFGADSTDPFTNFDMRVFDGGVEFPGTLIVASFQSPGLETTDPDMFLDIDVDDNNAGETFSIRLNRDGTPLVPFLMDASSGLGAITWRIDHHIGIDIPPSTTYSLLTGRDIQVERAVDASVFAFADDGLDQTTASITAVVSNNNTGEVEFRIAEAAATSWSFVNTGLARNIFSVSAVAPVSSWAMNSSGDVGVGGVSPTARMHVRAPSTIDTAAMVADAGATGFGSITSIPKATAFTFPEGLSALKLIGGTSGVGNGHSAGVVFQNAETLGTWIMGLDEVNSDQLKLWVTNKTFPVWEVTTSRLTSFTNPGTSTGSIQMIGTGTEPTMAGFAPDANRRDVRITNTGIHILAHAATGSPGSTDGLIVDTSGDVNIGTVAGGSRLNIFGANSDGLSLLRLSMTANTRSWEFQQDGTGSTSNLRLRAVQGAASAEFNIDTDDFTRWRSSTGTVQMSFNHNLGFLGVNTTLPNAPIHISKGQNGNTRVITENLTDGTSSRASYELNSSGARVGLLFTAPTSNTEFGGLAANAFNIVADAAASTLNLGVDSSGPIQFFTGAFASANLRASISSTGKLTSISDDGVEMRSVSTGAGTTPLLFQMFNQREGVNGTCTIQFQHDTDLVATQQVTYATIGDILIDNTNGVEDGALRFQTITAGSLVERLRLQDTQMLLNQIAINTNMSVGLTILNDSSTSEMISLKHPNVNLVFSADGGESDTFGNLAVDSATEGGILMRGMTESARAMLFRGFATTPSVAVNATVTGVIEFQGFDDASGSLIASENLMTMKTGSATNVILIKGDGSIWTGGDLHLGGPALPDDVDKLIFADQTSAASQPAIRYNATLDQWETRSTIGGAFAAIAVGITLFQATATATDSIVGASGFVQLDSMTITPGAGSYIVHFNSSAGNTNNGNTSDFRLVVNGVTVAHTVRTVMGAAGGRAGVSIVANITGVLAGHIVEIEWNNSSNTAECEERTLVLIRHA